LPPVGVEAREVAARAALAQHPDALVAAINDEGLFVEMPASVPLTRHRVPQISTFLHLVPREDRPTVITAWQEAQESGAGLAHVHLASDPTQAAVIQIIDVREAYGIFLGILMSEGNIEPLVDMTPATPRLPRVAHTRKNAVSVFLAVDAATIELLGWAADELVGRRSVDFIHPDDQEPAIESWMEMLASPGPGPPTRMRHQRRDGSWLWVEITNDNRLADPAHDDVLSEVVDISDEMAAHEDLRARERLLERIAEALPTGVCHADADRRIVYTNERLHEILGTPRAATIDEQLAVVLRDDWSVLDAALVGALRDGVDADVEVQIQRAGHGGLRRCLTRVRALQDDDGTPNGAIVTVEDVTDSAQMRTELERRANYDMLTRCHNRASVMTAVEVALAQGSDTTTAVIFVDIDRFKMVNDTLGHAAGDDLLVVVADRLAAAIRSNDILGRIGGDEFLVVCSSIRGRDEALEVGERISSALRGTVASAGAQITLRASVGVACSDISTRSADELVGQADAAMYESKREGEGRVVLFQSSESRAEVASPELE
jgi:diguanylate cyclase (GGDEF)-like protein/PAS domain S-box-containing protein